jgi:hypothetical protein
VAVQIALDSYAVTRSDSDRGALVSALDVLLPQARVVGLTVPAGPSRDTFDALGTACSNYRRRLHDQQDPSLGAAEAAARQAMKAAAEAIQTRFNAPDDRH